MPNAKLTGFDDYLAAISKLDANTEEIAKMALYDGARMMADATRNSISALPTVDDKYNIIAYHTGKKSKLSHAQKKGLEDSLGITKFSEDANGTIETKIGFDGYNDVKTKKYPKGQPNQLIARVVESGSSYMDKTPFLRKTVNQNKKRVEETMKESAEKRIQEIIKE